MASCATARAASIILAFTMLLPACRKAPPEMGPDVVAQIGDRQITAHEVTEEMRRRPVSSATNTNAESRRRSALDSLIDDEVLFQQARAAGLDRDPEVARRIQRLVVQEFRERNLCPESEPALSQSELRSWYDQHPETFLEPAQVQATLISLRVPRTAPGELRQSARRRLEQARETILAAADKAQAFAQQAREISDDSSTRRQGGNTGWLTEGRLTRWPQEVTAYLFQPSTGAAPGPGPVIETPEGLFLVGIADRRPAHRRPFHEVQPALAHRVAQSSREEKQRELVARARSAAAIRENPTALAAIPVPTPASALTHTAPALPGAGRTTPPLESSSPSSIPQP